MIHRRILLLLSALLIGAAGCSRISPMEWMGAYRLADGRLVSIRSSSDGTYRYRFYEGGESGRLFPLESGEYVSGPGLSGREPVTLKVSFEGPGLEPGHLLWQPEAGEPTAGRRVGASAPVAFERDGVTLRGRLDLPEGPGPHPAVVLVHGSGRSAATRTLPDGDFFVAHGVAVLVYDKRGTGESGGDFTFDFQELARDAVAGARLLRDRPELDPERIGYCGYSQGGWVAPLAASLDDSARFVVVSYGMIESPAEEARLEMIDHMRERGAGDAAVAEADPLIRAAIEIVASGFDDGWKNFERLDRRTEERSWRPTLKGTPVDELLSKPKWLVKLVGPRRAPKGLPWHYDSKELLERSDIPMVWLLGAEDRSAPNAETIRMLRALHNEGKPYDLTVFPGADHTMLVFHTEDGRRVYTGYHPDYYPMEVEAVRRLAGLN